MSASAALDRQAVVPAAPGAAPALDIAGVALVIALAPLFLFPSQDRVWPFFLSALVLLGRGVVTGRAIARTIFDWPIAVLLLQVLMTTFVVADSRLALPKVAGALYGVLVFYAVVAATASASRLRVAIALYAGLGVVFAAVGSLGMVTNNLMEKRFAVLMALRERFPTASFRLPGAEDGFDPNPVAGTLVLFLPLLVAWLWRAGLTYRTSKTQVAGLLASAASVMLALLVLLLTQSRGAWMGVFVAGWVVAFAAAARSGRRLRRVALAFPLVTVALLGLYFAILGFDQVRPGLDELSSKMGGRRQAWSVGLEAIRAHPLTGIGMNHLRLNEGIGYRRAHAHNHLIHTAAELGIPASLALLAIYVLVARAAARVWNGSRDEWFSLAAIGLAAGQLAHAVFGITDSVPLGAKPGGAFWLSLALLASIAAGVRTRTSGDAA